MPAPPPWAAGVCLPPPFFLRQLRTADAWGDPATEADVRADQVMGRVFHIEDPPVPQSLFLVTSADDFRRVLVGMCANLYKPQGSPFRFVPFAAAELAAVGITPTHISEDLTGCYTASHQLHHDANASPAALRQLCVNAFHTHRSAVVVSKPGVVAHHADAANEACPACPTPAHPAARPPCTVAACLALPAPPVAAGS